MKHLVILLISAWSTALLAKPVDSLEQLPVAKDATYVFFYHGAIAEGTVENPISERHGIYDLSGLKQSLDSDAYYLIAETREKNASVQAHAQRLADTVSKLIQQGVNPENISIIGFSKGGGIVATAAGLIGNSHIRYALLASCPKASETVVWPPFEGHLLSLYEQDDFWAGSCGFLTQGSPKVSEFKEIALETGLGHGEFYRPQQRWLEPLLAWVSPEKNQNGQNR